MMMYEGDKNSIIEISQLMTLRMQELSKQARMWPYLLYVLRMSSITARMMMTPMTITAIMAPEPERHREKTNGRLVC